jgi:hypothetical protein
VKRKGQAMFRAFNACVSGMNDGTYAQLEKINFLALHNFFAEPWDARIPQPLWVLEIHILSPDTKQCR